MVNNAEIVQGTLIMQAIASGGVYGLFPLLMRSQYDKTIGGASGDNTTATALQATSVGAFLTTFALKGDAHSKKLALLVGSGTALVWACAAAAKALPYKEAKPKHGIVAAVVAAVGFFVAMKKTGPF